MIESYKFGEIVINSVTYTSDLIVYPDKVDDTWWRKESHALHKDDLTDVVRYEPEVIIVGSGEPGLMKVLYETKQFIESKGIELIIENTKNACKKYNELSKNKNVVATLHLTC
jgi:hypothetical protein